MHFGGDFEGVGSFKGIVFRVVNFHNNKNWPFIFNNLLNITSMGWSYYNYPHVHQRIP